MASIFILAACIAAAQDSPVHQPFAQETQTGFVPGEGLPERTPEGELLTDFTSVVISPDGKVAASAVTNLTNGVLLEFDGEAWRLLDGSFGDVIDSPADDLAASRSGRVYYGGPLAGSQEFPEEKLIVDAVLADGGKLVLTGEGLFLRGAGETVKLLEPEDAYAVAAGPGGAIAVGTKRGLLIRAGEDAGFVEAEPADARYAWSEREVTAVAFDSKGRLWFGASQGVGVLDNGEWSLYTGDEGLPYGDFTCARAGEDGVIWFGTPRGAIRFDGEHWSYRAGLRWLPDDHVNDIAVDSDGTAWVATKGGISRIEREPMTLEDKAAYFIEQVETRHNRDGYITDWRLEKCGDVSSAVSKITDNDGNYTACYGAAMAYRYAITGDAEAKRLAKRSFEACKFLVDVVPDEVNGVDMRGFPARVAIPVDWPEPVNEQYGEEYNQRRQQTDPFWKQITPRFPLSEDGKYRWKCDTSSDELVAHYYFYGVYYDLVAETEAEKAPVREVVAAITDHLMRNDFSLVDHDGKPTRWARLGPDELNSVHHWAERGLNSLMLLSFMATAEHITGDPKYAECAQMLREEHNYHINTLWPRTFFPPDYVVPWDNNLSMKAFYPLMMYENDPELLLVYRQSLEHLALFIEKQKSPLWNFMYGACAKRFQELAQKGHFDGAYPEAGPYAAYAVGRLAEFDQRLEDSLDTLRQLPLLLIGWEMKNSHRLDVQLDPQPGQSGNIGWSKVTGKALPIEERSHVRQDRDNLVLDASEDGGWAEHEGTFYLLPYYMARYHGFL